MGNSTAKEPPPPVVLVPPLFDFPPLSARNRMLETSYNMLFGKLALKCLFQDYFEQASHFSAKIMLKPVDDPHVDMIFTLMEIFGGCKDRAPAVDGPIDHRPEAGLAGKALFRWRGDLEDPNKFVDLSVSNSNLILQLRSCAYHPKCGFGAFGVFPLLLKNGVPSLDKGYMGLRYGSENLSLGATVMPFSFLDALPRNAWLVSKLGRLTFGVQYEPQSGSKDPPGYKNLTNWSCAAGYGVGSGIPLSPSFNFSLELANSSQLVASFYQHVVVQRRLKNPFEKDGVAAITNYIDFGFELHTRIEYAKEESNVPDSDFQVAASWQINKNFMLKGKVGPRFETAAMAFKSWWTPSLAFNISATRDRITGKTSLGFGIRVEDIKKASYQRADPDYVMLTPNKEHAADELARTVGSRPVLSSENLEAGNYEGVPGELKPMTKIL